MEKLIIKRDGGSFLEMRELNDCLYLKIEHQTPWASKGVILLSVAEQDALIEYIRNTRLEQGRNDGLNK